ncbi:ABC transporter ATP-binding protein [Rhizobium sp. CC-YZS058]|uniref:ABC transporter ATP-binding protein n=1 Tax=Rhizobium sp. CC-YZS058 TaxID=3042153 RepID=UPI002B058500|nr:ATP-binding cassette domain-containing protein [Rhizobium sp. CC-YZS058]MEA3535876.1 ATP-binding cassette domain-containing protein [Rhizobium sp. CC-YZS058]
MDKVARKIALEAAAVVRQFPVKGRKTPFTAVDTVSLRLYEGETLALVGESGSGKTTLSRMMLGLLPPTRGDVQVFGRDISTYSRLDLAGLVQPVFQDPYASLNPRKRLADIIAMPLRAAASPSREEVRKRVEELLQQVGLPASFAERFPHELSGGQRQRVAIARALINRPRVLICDEPTSALDVSVQAQILELLKELRMQFGLSYLIVTHNIGVVSELCDRVAVMYHGRIVEYGNVDEVLSDPADAYTRRLLSAVLPVDPDLARPAVSAAISLA